MSQKAISITSINQRIMKSIIALGITCIILFTSCHNEKEVPVVSITGVIHNYEHTQPILRDFLGKAEWADSIEVSDGKFAIDIPVDQPTIKSMTYGYTWKDIFLVPGESLDISFDANNFDSSLVYGGSLALENSILDSVSTKVGNIDYSIAYYQPLEVATRYLDSLKNVSQLYFTELTKNETTSPLFEDYVNGFIEYKIASLKIVIGERAEERDANYYAFIDDLSFENENLLEILDYRFFLYEYLSMKTNRRYEQLDSLQQQASNVKFDETLKEIEQFKNDKVREFALYSSLHLRLMENGLDGFEDYYDLFKNTNKEPIYSEKIKKEYESKLRLAPGQPAPEFTLTDIEGNQFSLSDFEGKYVYLDFWLTTCPRAEREMPHLLELQSDYAEEDLAFVSISLDDNKEVWSEYVKEKRNSGYSLRTNPNFKVDEDYQIFGTPWFTLIDKEGNIIDPIAAKPSSPEIRQTLDQLLKSQ